MPPKVEFKTFGGIFYNNSLIINQKIQFIKIEFP